MYRHILIPTDGSALAEAAASAGTTLAAALGASVTGYHAVSPLRQEFWGEDIRRDPFLLRLKQEAMQAGMRHVEVIGEAAARAGVRFTPVVEAVEPVYQGIVDAARSSRCDLIVMASHGRTGVKRLLLGSVASQVLAHSEIPVLVHR